MAEEELSQEEKEALYQYLNQSGAAPTPEEKHNVHTFLFRIATADDTTKVGYLKDEEVGTPRHPVRALKEFSLISGQIMNNPFISSYFAAESENITATSLSRDGFLPRLAVTQTRQIADITKKRQKNKGWFSKKEDKDENQEQQL